MWEEAPRRGASAQDTGAPVVTVDAGLATAQRAAESIRRLRLDRQVTIAYRDGYLGEPTHAPYDRADGVILAPVARMRWWSRLGCKSQTPWRWRPSWCQEAVLGGHILLMEGMHGQRFSATNATRVMSAVT